LTVIVTECETEPTVPVTVTVYPPTRVLCRALKPSVEVPCPPGVNATEELLSEALGPGVGETVVERVTVPANPPRLVSVITAVPEEPRDRLSEDGLIEIEKSDTITVTDTEWTSEPFVPVTVTV